MTHPSTLSLFGDEAPHEQRLSQALTRMDTARAAQRNFQKLVAQVTRSREKLEHWQACDERVQQRMAAELAPRMMRMRGLQLDIVGRLDALLQAPRAAGAKARSQSARLRAWLRRLIDTLDPEGNDVSLDPLRVRHQCESPRERDARARARMLEAIKEAFAPEPDELAKLDGADLDELLDYAERSTKAHLLRQLPPAMAKALSQADTASAKRETHRQAKRERAGIALKDEAAHASQSLRDVYRRLAMALHPDRELDPERRREKTTLIQRVNQAYASRDLLTLLGIHLDTQPTDAPGLGALPDEKLEHFSQILRQQLADLDAGIERLVKRLGEAANLPPWQKPSSKLIDQAISLDIAQTDRFIQDLEADLARLLASGTGVTRLASLPDEDPAEHASDALDALLAMVAASAPPAPRRKRR